MPDKSKTFVGTEDQLFSILSWASNQIKTLSLSDREYKRVELALEEAVINILKHGKVADGYVQLTVTISDFLPQKIRIELKDNGKAFNPLAYRIQDQRALSIEERELGGLGIMLILQSMDEVAYCFENGWNCAHIDQACVLSFL